MVDVDIIMLNIDISKSHVNLIISDVDINNSHVNIIVLHVDIIYLACWG